MVDLMRGYPRHARHARHARRPQHALCDAEAPAADIDATVEEEEHRWLGRSGIVAGGAASLAIGAIFGGVLEGVPGLLAPPVASGLLSAGGPVGSSGRLPVQLAASRATPPGWSGVVSDIFGSPPSATGTGAGGGQGATSATAGTPPVSGGGGTTGGGPGVGSSGGGSGTGTSGGGAQSTGNAGSRHSSGGSPPPCDSACSAVGGVLGAVAQAVSQLPGGSNVSGVVAQVGSLVPSLPAAPTPTVASVPPPAPGAPAPVPASASVPGTVSGVTSTLGGTLSAATGLFHL
jgi:hypothetical protein